MRYWAYKHVNGGLHLKMYREDMPNARASIDDAYESGFVAEVIEPFEADSRQQAEEIVKARLAQVACKPCNNCEYVTTLTQYNGKKYEVEGELEFCKVCASTFLYRAIAYPRQYGDQQPLWASIGYIANMILDKIRNRR